MCVYVGIQEKRFDNFQSFADIQAIVTNTTVCGHFRDVATALTPVRQTGVRIDNLTST